MLQLLSDSADSDLDLMLCKCNDSLCSLASK